MIGDLRGRELVSIVAVTAVGLAGSAVALAHRGADAQFVQDQRHPQDLRPSAVSRVVRTAPDPRTGKGSGIAAVCSSGRHSELGNPWSCVVTYRDGHKVRLRVRISNDGTYTGRYAGGGGAQGCCIDLPGAQ